jgi:Transcriptional regulators
MTITEQLNSMRMFVKYYETKGKAISAPFNLTTTEFNVVSFLTSNPGLNTAKDIEELRRIPKATISIAVDSLIAKKLVTRKEDNEDRRKIHLFLTAKAEPLKLQIKELQKEMAGHLFSGFSEEESEQFGRMNERILANIEKAFKEIEK